MKTCEYCGAQHHDNATKCENCGANTFRHVCANCGNEFNDGAFCPICGVKVGEQPKYCPRCGKEYFSNACPNCGYVAGQNAYQGQSNYQYQQPYTPVYTQPLKKRKTWLWVLGWIFMYPVPLSIIVAKNKSLNKIAKIAIIVVAWLSFLLLGVFGSSETDDADSGTDTSTVVVQETEESFSDYS